MGKNHPKPLSLPLSLQYSILISTICGFGLVHQTKTPVCGPEKNKKEKRKMQHQI